jgi:hypothetical protein
MTVTSAFTKIKGGCFLYVKMAEAAAATLCRKDDVAKPSNQSNVSHRVELHWKQA